MAYTVKQVAAMSGVSVRTLHFYDEAGLLKPAFLGSNGYRFYEQQQLLTLQQILFYRELGLELKQIKQTLHRPDFEKTAALRSHRDVLQTKLARLRALLDTIGNTITHLEGETTMKTEDLFAGFRVAAGEDRFNEHIKLGGEPHDCKVSAQDTNGALSVFEFTGSGGGPRHLHHEQDEWIYVIDGALDLEVGGNRQHLRTGESAFLPRNVVHGWVSADGHPAKIINAYQPSGKIEDFFREVGKYNSPPIHEVLSYDDFCSLFHAHGLKVAGPPIVGEWQIDAEGRILRIS